MTTRCHSRSYSHSSCSPAAGAKTAEQPSSPAAAGAFPVTIEHKFGETTIDSEPKRIVVVGLREQDALLALGIVPVGTTEWYGEHPGAIFPWAEAALGDAQAPTKSSASPTASSTRRSPRSRPT